MSFLYIECFTKQRDTFFQNNATNTSNKTVKEKYGFKSLKYRKSTDSTINNRKSTFRNK